jgi:diketogulonate reductase-like aldo/keto reductase
MVARLLLLSVAAAVAGPRPAAAFAAIPKIAIAPGVQMPMLVMGTGSGQKGDVANATQLWLGAAGGIGIDTAYGYYDEAEIAEGMTAAGKTRADVFLETKIPCSSYETAKVQLQSNLDQLKVSSVDLVLIHFPCSSNGGDHSGGDGTWRALEEFQKAGNTRAIGVSNYKVADLEALTAGGATVTPAVNQCKHSVVSHDDELLAYCRKAGITYQAYSPLCGGYNGSSCSRGGGANVLTNPSVATVAAAHKKSAAQIGLKWIVQQGIPVTTAVWDLAYMKEDMDLWSWGDLTPAEMAALSADSGNPGYRCVDNKCTPVGWAHGTPTKVGCEAICGPVKDCPAALKRACGSAQKTSAGNCLVCCTRHQRGLEAAGCESNDLDNFCHS